METPVIKAAARLIKQHGSIRKAAEAIGIDYVYLHRLHTGEKTNPSDEVLRLLGLERVVTYRQIKC